MKEYSNLVTVFMYPGNKLFKVKSVQQSCIFKVHKSQRLFFPPGCLSDKDTEHFTARVVGYSTAKARWYNF